MTFNKNDYYTITSLAKVFGVSFNTVLDRVNKGEIKPDYIAPITGKKYFHKGAIEKMIHGMIADAVKRLVFKTITGGTASGGIVSGRTLGLMEGYRQARKDSDTPLDKLKGE